MPDEPESVSTRVDALLEAMELREKAGQLVGTAPFMGGTSIDAVERAVREGDVGSVSPTGLGFGGQNSPRDFVEFINRVQRLAVEETRLGIPLLVPTDAIHGLGFVDGATIFPHNLAMAATRDPALVERVAAATAAEMRAVGTNQTYNPTADVARELRWGRVMETFGESPFLCARLVEAEVAGYQGTDLAARDAVAATVKHFPAYSEPSRGEDTAPVDRSPASIHRVFLPPFRAAIERDVAAVMPCYNAIDGEPVHGSARYLDDLLREDLGFEGYVTSDWNGVEMLHADHKTAASMRSAVSQSHQAGLDVASVGGVEHADHLRALVDAGELAESRLDESVRRVLALKFRLGLFEDPFVDANRASTHVGTADHRSLAVEAARRVMTLLQNDGVLPLSREMDEVFVTGPNADSLVNQCGGWTAREAISDGVTVRDGLEAVAGDAMAVTYAPGAGIRSPVDIDRAVTAAADADAAIVVLGEDEYIHEFIAVEGEDRPTGSFPTRTQLSLPTAQRDLLQRVHRTGTPTVLVLITGRPLAIPWAAENVPGILMAYYPGAMGGQAIAETLFGAWNPAGRLPVSMPRSTGHLPTRFNHLPHPTVLADEEFPPSYDPLFPFGHGLCYTEFTHDALDLSGAPIATDGSLDLTLTVTNTGDRPGRETVDLMVRDVISSRVTPVRELRGFGTRRLDPGASGTITASLDARDLGVVYPDGLRETEPGQFAVTFGRQEASFDVVAS